MKKGSILPDEIIINKILIQRDQKVMLDRDLAQIFKKEKE
jgi:hypothetical protein